MPRKKEDIKFVVISHYSGNKPIKDLLKNLIMREITDTNQTDNKFNPVKLTENTAK